MSGHLALKSLILFLALIVSIGWSATAMSASDGKKDKKNKPTSSAPKKADETAKKAGKAPKEPEATSKKADEASQPDQPAKRTDETAKKVDESDLHQACLAKIPDDATGGQRLLAEQSCTREDERRKQSGSAARF